MRLFTDGAEFGDIYFWDVWTNTVVGTAKRNGNYGYNCAQSNLPLNQKYFPALSELYFRAAFYQAYAWYSESGSILGFMNNANVVLKIGVVASTSRMYGTINGNTFYGVQNCPAYTWFSLEVYLLISNSGRVITKLNGTTDIDYSGDTLGTYSTVNNFGFTRQASSGSLNIDDIALNDTTNYDGLNDNSWCNDGGVLLLMPNANGTHNNWTGSDGNKTDNYLLVDELPSSGTDYVYSITNKEQDQYGLASFTATNAQITRVIPEARAMKGGSAPAYVKMGILPSGSVDCVGPARELSTTYRAVLGNQYKTNPADGGAWETADIDALELVLEYSGVDSTKYAYTQGV